MDFVRHQHERCGGLQLWAPFLRRGTATALKIRLAPHKYDSWWGDAVQHRRDERLQAGLQLAPDLVIDLKTLAAHWIRLVLF